PARSIPIPLVMFAHQNPFGFDEPGGPPPPRGYALDPAGRTSTQDILLYTDIGVSLADAVFPAGGPTMATRANEVADRFRDPATTRPGRDPRATGGGGRGTAWAPPPPARGGGPARPTPPPGGVRGPTRRGGPGGGGGGERPGGFPREKLGGGRKAPPPPPPSH